MRTLKILTYNILYGTSHAEDGHAWRLRRDSVAGLIAGRGADIVCVQEALIEQVHFLEAALPDYARVGVGRDDGREAGEHSALFYRKERFELLSAENFWMSETPAVPSLGWDAHHRRICSAARLREAGGEFLAASLHLDHAGTVARLESAKLLRRLFGDRAEQCFLAGDYNLYDSDEPFRLLCSPPFADALAVAPERTEIASWQGLEPATLKIGGSIDHVVFTPGAYQPVRAEVLAVKRGGQYPSDHFPVLAEFTAE